MITPKHFQELLDSGIDPDIIALNFFNTHRSSNIRISRSITIRISARISKSTCRSISTSSRISMR
ncbi:MAG: hypothetical protein ACKO9G_24775, partial [Dolichospermum sp.]